MTMRKALAFEKVCNEMPMQLLDQELIVGTTTMSSVGFGHTFPKYETDEEAEESPWTERVFGVTICLTIPRF